ncbi:zwei Ig domain protein zig-8-like [Lutzomyia longipalpis]|uniref:zwei Ig domain protein zig-8-like n=1 Tax=Lutzomyia longipalpis TaxID=7200 RepID=UPI00248364A2|nr:zwei Ig domain protein zig-8-like [Lutzomyia longipalpis]
MQINPPPQGMLTLVTVLVFVALGEGSMMSFEDSVWDSPPYFDDSTVREVTAAAGYPAMLRCRVRNIGDRAVSWIRRRDLHILAIGIMTYTNDPRFQAEHSEGSDDWTLKIRSARPADSGVYECQISIDPKISLGIHLNVIASHARILGGREVFVRRGSDVNLTCLVETAPAPIELHWARNGRPLDFSQRGGMSILSERRARTSQLLMSRVSPRDAGNYSCYPMGNSGTDAAFVLVHVIKDENSAAMQHESSAPPTEAHSIALFAAIVVTLSHTSGAR